ncbi:hypothetical protein LTR56_024906 [Elasticomyces elasticus]|nr:hypothetical protein LTR56_024906 [Elasticomyces elasticus]KAK3638933.1 hypothetical protein LTR22_017617 [Elasticomyces elasticus]KAK4905488.1 hypothetical protein LTR49_025223 [Elasticomyces elasticus]KAK5752570.1 hypothetical protein LTS12_017320 [Elasticomyces elasticus]
MSYTFATVISYMGRDGTMQTYSLLPLEIDEGNGTPSPPHSPGPWPQTPRRVATPISYSPEPASPGFRSEVPNEQATVSAREEETGKEDTVKEETGKEEHDLSPSTEMRKASERKRRYLKWLWMK